MLCSMLKEWGWRCVEADDGTAAVAAVEKNSYDAVLMDVRMIRVSGLEALEDIRAFNPALPVIIMTAYSSIESAVEALQKGAYDYLTKPLDFEKLKVTIQRAMEHDTREECGTTVAGLFLGVLTFGSALSAVWSLAFRAQLAAGGDFGYTRWTASFEATPPDPDAVWQWEAAGAVALATGDLPEQRLILLGGVLYTLGTVFYLANRLVFHNTIWHCFVLAASLTIYAGLVVAVVL